MQRFRAGLLALTTAQTNLKIRACGSIREIDGSPLATTLRRFEYNTFAVCLKTYLQAIRRRRSAS